MNFLADRLSRWAWLWILRSMRKPEVRWLQVLPKRWLSPDHFRKYQASLRRQNRFALRYGRRILTVAFFILMLSAITSYSYSLLATYYLPPLIESGQPLNR